MRVPRLAAVFLLGCGIQAGCGGGDGGFPVTGRVPGTFQSTIPATTPTLGGPPHGTVEVDWDGDGDRDLLTANEDTDDVTVLLANGRGGYDAGGPFPSGPGASGVAGGHFDLDRRIDAAVTSSLSDSVSILLQGPASSMQVPLTVPAGVTAPGPIVAGRFDLDPFTDLVVMSLIAPEARLLRGDGVGGFYDGGPVDVSISAFHAVLGDLDGDGRDDLVVRGDGAVQVLRGLVEGGFESTGVYPVGTSVGRVVLAPMDGVPGPEVLTTDEDDATLSIFPNLGGLLGAPLVREARAGAVGVATGDLDQDGDLDVVVACEGIHFLMTYSGHGDGTVEPGLLIPVLDGCHDVYVNDLDGDGVLDLTVVLVHPVGALFTMLGS